LDGKVDSPANLEHYGVSEVSGDDHTMDQPVTMLKDTGGPAAAGEGINRFDEPLAISAPLALAAAKRLCRHAPLLGQSCLSFHGTWQYRRLFGLLTSISNDQQHGFFHDALGALAVAGRHARVLITGAADYAMMALVLRAYRDRKAKLDLTVLDCCETPLFLNRWYAERASHPLELSACDILEFESPRPFDVICAHSFVNQFPPTSRPELIAKWRQLLRPGGKLVMINRIWPAAEEGPFSAKPERVKVFRAKMLRAAERWPDLTGATPEELAGYAADQMGRQIYLVNSLERLCDLLADGGFAVERLETSPAEEATQLSAALYPDKAQPTQSRFYAHLVCARR
jgi:SAM-dependent methyltransferase